MPRTTARSSPIAAAAVDRASLISAPGLLRVLVERRVGHAEAHRQRDQPGLGAVVQVALQAPRSAAEWSTGRRGLGQHLDPLLEASRVRL